MDFVKNMLLVCNNYNVTLEIDPFVISYKLYSKSYT